MIVMITIPKLATQVLIMGLDDENDDLDQDGFDDCNDNNPEINQEHLTMGLMMIAIQFHSDDDFDQDGFVLAK